MTATNQGTVALLAAAPVFSGLEPCALQRLAQACGSRRYPKGQILFHQGDPGDCLYVLVEGLVMVVVGSPAGDRMVVATCRPPEAFGEIALIDNGPRTASVEALAPTRVLTINRADFLAILRAHPSLAESLLQVVGRLFRQTLERTSDFVFLDLQGRVAKCLVQLADARGEPTTTGVSVELGLTQAEFAAMVGGSRPSVNQILRGLADRGILTLDGRRILLKRLDHLRRRANL
ncbi:MAG: Crp/Fnr family transcriptional regulator [Pseudonocardiales bacterium]|nr:Crp/Fnr family transcriptional regulator [Pseudonocardiales bacterium]